MASLIRLIKSLSIKSILLLALFFRMLLSPFTYHGDVTVNYWWGKFALDFNLRGYYDWLFFGGYAQPDQPMLYILFYRTVRQIYLLIYQIFWFLNVNIPAFPSKYMQWYFDHGNQILEKYPIIIADLILIYFGYRFILSKFNRNKAILFSFILALYPPLIYNTALWGGNDSLLNLLALIAIILYYQRRFVLGTVFFTVCLLFKSSLIIFSPLILIIVLRQKISPTSLVLSILTFLTIVYLVALPFSTKFPLTWLFETYSSKILPGAMPQLTANAMNVWALFYGLVPRLDEIKLIGQLSARNLSLFICFSLYILVSINLWRHFTQKRLLLSLVNISLITFIFMTRMHERYSFPALIPLLTLCFYDKSYRKYFIILTLTHLLNVYHWWWQPNIPILINLLKNDIIVRTISLINVLLTLQLIRRQLNDKTTN